MLDLGEAEGIEYVCQRHSGRDEEVLRIACKRLEWQRQAGSDLTDEQPVGIRLREPLVVIPEQHVRPKDACLDDGVAGCARVAYCVSSDDS